MYGKNKVKALKQVLYQWKINIYLILIEIINYTLEK